MKKLLLFAAFLLQSLLNFGQTNYSGTYGYSFEPQVSPPKNEKATGHNGKLVLLKMEENKYRFWLDVATGWPGNSVGETDGTITFLNDTASFDNTFEDATTPCVLKFKISNKVISVNSMSTSFNCGFGDNVSADGDYSWLKPQPVLNNDWLRKEYNQAPNAKVIANKAEIFKDENCINSFSPKKYFMKGDNILNISDTEKSVYTEYIPSPGKFIYGWIKKTALELINTD